jgi:hypothetical protein
MTTNRTPLLSRLYPDRYPVQESRVEAPRPVDSRPMWVRNMDKNARDFTGRVRG